MKQLPLTASVSDVNDAAIVLGLEVQRGSTLWELWQDRRYLGGYAELDGLITELNQRLTWLAQEQEIARDEAAEQAKKSALALAEAQAASVEQQRRMAHFTDAVLLRGGKVIGTCMTDAKAGDNVAVYGGLDDNGQPLNIRYCRVSRSKANFARASQLPVLGAYVFRGDVYYG